MEKRELAEERAMAEAIVLLSYYGFELGNETPEQVFACWLEQYPANWVRLAAIEAIYLGRYKAVSVTQILALWHRYNQIRPHFNYEFESLVCRNLPQLSILASEVGDSQTESSSDISSEEQSKKKLTPKSNSRSAPTSIPEFTPTFDKSEFSRRLKTILEESRKLLEGEQEDSLN